MSEHRPLSHDSLWQNTFSSSAFRAVPDNAESLEFIAIGFDDVTVVNKDDGLVRNVFADGGEVRFQSLGGNSLVKMSGKALDGIDFLGIFMELVNDIGQERALRGKYAVGHVSSKFSVWFGEGSGNFFGKG